PSSFTIAPGATQRVRLRFARTKAAMGRYVTGNVVFADGSHRVRIPAVAKPSALQAQESVNMGKRTRVSTTAGVRAKIRPRIRGLVPAVDTDGQAQNTERAAFDPNDERNYVQRVQAGKATQALRKEVRADFPADDLDLYVFDPNWAFVAQSSTAGSDEVVTVPNPYPGKYYSFDQARSTHDNAAKTKFKLHTFAVGAKNTGTLRVNP